MFSLCERKKKKKKHTAGAVVSYSWMDNTNAAKNAAYSKLEKFKK